MLEKPAIKDKAIVAYVTRIEERLKIFETSPIAETYLTVYFQIKSFNAQLKLGEPKTEVGQDGITTNLTSGFVDLFAGKDDKSFDRTKWYFENILALNKTLLELRKLMTPEEIKEVDKVTVENGVEQFISQ